MSVDYCREHIKANMQDYLTYRSWRLSILSNKSAKRSKMYKNDGKTTHLSVAKYTLTRAVQLIACDSHAHLVMFSNGAAVKICSSRTSYAISQMNRIQI